MSDFIWRIRCAYHLSRVYGWKLGWYAAGQFDARDRHDMTPSEAAHEELTADTW